MVVIIRGGGATSDLSGFDTYNLAAHCAQFPLPIITGIGHERDDTVLDLISHTRVKTPTAAAEFLINRMLETATALEQLASSIYEIIPQRLQRESERIERMITRVPSMVQSRLQREILRCERMTNKIEMSWNNRLMRENYRLDILPRIVTVLESRIQKETHRLELLEHKVKASSPELLLKKGYSITIKKGKAVTDISQLKPGDEVETRVAIGRFVSVVKELANDNEH